MLCIDVNSRLHMHIPFLGPRNFAARGSSNLLCSSPTRTWSLLVLLSTDWINWFSSFSYPGWQVWFWTMRNLMQGWCCWSSLVYSKSLCVVRLTQVGKVSWRRRAIHHGFTILSWDISKWEPCKCNISLSQESGQSGLRRRFSWMRRMMMGLSLRVDLLVPN